MVKPYYIKKLRFSPGSRYQVAGRQRVVAGRQFMLALCQATLATTRSAFGLPRPLHGCNDGVFVSSTQPCEK